MSRRWVLIAAVLCGCAHPHSPSPAERALAARERGDLEEAYRWAAEALCATPDLVLARHLVEAWHALGAAGAPTHRLGGCPLPPVVNAYLTGLVAGARGDVAAAEAALAGAEADAALDDRAEIAYRRALIVLGADPAAALAHLERASGLEPGRVDVRLAATQALIALGRLAEAQARLVSVVALRPTLAELDRARQLNRNLVHRNEPELPQNVERTLGDLLAQLGTGSPSPESLARAQGLVAELGHPRVLKVAGLVALHRGLTDEARDRLEEAARLNPLDPEPWRIQGAALVTREQPREAWPLLVEAQRRDPFDAELARLCAGAATAAEAWAGARDAYAALVLLEPRAPEHFLGLARVERRLGRPDPARAAAEQGLAVAPAHLPLLVELASLEAEGVKRAADEVARRAARERTRAALERLLAVAPEHPAAAAIAQAVDL